ncbi:MAG: hypothetical protein ABGY09_08045 [Euryarchaeota archaeon]
MIEKKGKREGEIPRDYRVSSRDPFDHYFVVKDEKSAKRSKR